MSVALAALPLRHEGQGVKGSGRTLSPNPEPTRGGVRVEGHASKGGEAPPYRPPSLADWVGAAGRVGVRWIEVHARPCQRAWRERPLACWARLAVLADWRNHESSCSRRRVGSGDET